MEQTCPLGHATSVPAPFASQSSFFPVVMEQPTCATGTADGPGTHRDSTHRAAVGATPAVEQKQPNAEQSPTLEGSPLLQFAIRDESRHTLAVPAGGHCA